MDELLFTWDEDGKLIPYEEPFATIECKTEEEFEYIKEAVKHYRALVRCKNCKWRNTKGCPYENFDAVARADDDFCSDGERRNDGETD